MVRGKQYTTRVIEAGDGDPLILIHGVGSSAECFARNVMRLAKHFHLYAVDALYHGYSSKHPYDSDHRVQRQAEAVIDFMDAEGIARANVEGESMGAGIAFEMGMRFPERVGKLVLNSGNYYIDTPQLRQPRAGEAPTLRDPAAPGGGAQELVQRARRAVTEVTRENVRRRIEYFVARPERITDEMVELQYRLYSDPQINASMQRVFGITAPRGSLARWSEDEARTMKAPTLVIWTDRNVREAGEYLASLLPNGGCHTISDAYHWTQWEQPEEHDAAVIGFLGG